jgi:hypothetical protein
MTVVDSILNGTTATALNEIYSRLPDIHNHQMSRP